MKVHKDKYVAGVEKYMHDSADTFTLMNYKHTGHTHKL